MKTSSNRFKGMFKAVLSTALILALFIGVFGAFVSQADAATPTLSVTSASFNTVQLTVYGDQNASVQLYYYAQGSNIITSAGYVGTTNASGYFSTNLSTYSYGITPGTTVYVLVNGQQSANVVWPSTSSTTGGPIYLSQNNINLNVGQNATITISGGTGNYSISSNSNSTVVSASVAGNMVGVYGLASGSATLTICSNASAGSCGYLYVTVYGNSWNNTGTYSQLSLSQNNLSLSIGQTQYVTIYGATGYQGSYANNYYISNLPNSSVAQATISGNTITVRGYNPGSVSFSICSTSGSTSCTSLYVIVLSSYYNNYNNTYPNGYNGIYYGSTYPYGYPYGDYPTNYNYNSGFTYGGGSQYGYTQPSTYYTSGMTYIPSTTFTPTYTTPTYTYSNQTSGRPVSGVFLNQVPNTGISFGMKLTLFTLGLALWSIFAAYILHVKYGKGALVNKANSNSGQAALNADVNTAATPAERFKMIQMKKKGLL